MTTSNFAITVIIPCAGREQLLARALASVACQTFAPNEVIVVDDGSCPPLRLPREVDASCRLVRLPENRGAPAARNAGLELASGEFVALLDSDDEWFPNHLEHLVNIALRYTTDIPLLVIGGFRAKDAEGCDHDASTHLHAGDPRRSLILLTHRTMTTSTFLINRAALDGGLRFDPSLPALQDYDFALRAASAGRLVASSYPTARKHEQRQRVWTPQRALLARSRLEQRWVRTAHPVLRIVARVPWGIQRRYLEARAASPSPALKGQERAWNSFFEIVVRLLRMVA